MRVFLPNSAHLGNIEGFLRHFDPADPSRLEVAFHDRWVSVHPMVLAMVACVGATARADGIPVTVDVPNIRSLPYLVRMKLFEHLGAEKQVGKVIEHEASGRFIPITQVTSNAQLQQFIVDMVPLLHCEPQEAEPIKYVISEMVRNVLEHSGSKVGAFVCAQYFKKTNRLTIGIADAGRGVLEAMSVFHSPADAQQALRLAMRPGVTGTSPRYGGTEYNAGAGLFFTKSIAAASRNFFVFESGGAMFKLRRTPENRDVVLNSDPQRDIATWRSDIPVWPGTAVGINVAVGSHASFAELLGEIREAYSLDIHATKKARYKKARFL